LFNEANKKLINNLKRVAVFIEMLKKIWELNTSKNLQNIIIK
jgi:hypothetical protein